MGLISRGRRKVLSKSVGSLGFLMLCLYESMDMDMDVDMETLESGIRMGDGDEVKDEEAGTLLLWGLSGRDIEGGRRGR